MTNWFAFYRSIIEPVRNYKFRDESHYHLAKAVSVDTDKQLVKCVNILDSHQQEYDVEYDKLVIGVGARPNTFGVPGVYEHAFFLKVSDLLHYPPCTNKVFQAVS